TRGGGTNAGFVTALIGDVLHRPLNALDAFRAETALAVGLPRTVLATAVLASPEAKLQLVEVQFQRFLHRTVDAGTAAFAAGLLQEGLPDEVLMAALVGSQEYFDDATRDTQGPLVVIASPTSGLTTHDNI